jgi:hypothetical protein
MAAQSHPVKEFVQDIDNESLKEVMDYLKLEDYDVFVRYISMLGIQRKE